MKMKMYQVPVTKMYAIRAQVIMDGSEGSAGLPGDGEGGAGDVWD